MRLIGTIRDVARIGALVVLAAWFGFYRPASLGGSASYILVAGQSMLPTYRSGDLVIALPKPAYLPGDVVVFTVPAGEPGAGGQVIHRIVAERGGVLVTRGDNNGWDDRWQPTAANVLGSPVAHVPGAGSLLALVRTPMVAGVIGAVIAYVLLEPVLVHGSRRRRGPEAAEAAAGS